MKRIIEENIPEKSEYYSDLSGKKIVLEEVYYEASQLLLLVPTKGFLKDDYTGEWEEETDIEEIKLDITASEATKILKYLRRKYPKNEKLKTYLFLDEKKK